MREKNKEVFKGNQYTKSGGGKNCPHQKTSFSTGGQNLPPSKNIRKDLTCGKNYHKSTDDLINILNRQVVKTSERLAEENNFGGQKLPPQNLLYYLE